jgi:hypothetical protein
MWQECPSFVSGGETEATQRGVNLGELIQKAVILKNRPNEPNLGVIYDRITQICEKNQEYQIEAERLIRTPAPDIWGWADLVISDPFMLEAYLFEFKSGYGDRKPPMSNPQILMYAWGLLAEGFDRVKAYLIEIDQKKTEEAELTKDMIPLLEALAKALKVSVGTEARPGAYCKICGNILSCKEITQKLDLVVAENKQLPPDKATIQQLVQEATNDQIVQALNRYTEPFKIAEMFMGKLKEEAIKRLLAGEKLNGWTVKETSGPRQWEDPVTALFYLLGEGYNVDQITDLKSPAQIEKITSKEQAKYLKQFQKVTKRKSLVKEGSNEVN